MATEETKRAERIAELEHEISLLRTQGYRAGHREVRPLNTEHQRLLQEQAAAEKRARDAAATPEQILDAIEQGWRLP